jgi:hypothetical protein
LISQVPWLRNLTIIRQDETTPGRGRPVIDGGSF